MIFTLLCLICTTLLGILFKWAGQKQLRSYAVIPVNYALCFLMGFVHIGTAIFTQMSMDWLPHAFLLGVFFIAGFNIFARTIAVAGLPLAAMFQKMSIILTVLAALWMGDRLNSVQSIGLLAGIVSIVLALGNPIDQIPHRRSYYSLLLLTLLLSATIEILFLWINRNFGEPNNFQVLFPSYIFLFAGMIGFAAFHRRFKAVPLSRKEWGFGILLGIPNFYSIYFMILALQFELPGAVFFPVLNCGVIALSALSGYLIFREPINKFQFAGLLLSTASIFLITFFKS